MELPSAQTAFERSGAVLDERRAARALERVHPTAGREVDHTGEGFFVSFDDAASAVACTREIQRRLTEHRVRAAGQDRPACDRGDARRLELHRHGRAHRVRIGAIAGGGEIVASASSVEGLDGVNLDDLRMVPLKGIAEPDEVVTVAWR